MAGNGQTAWPLSNSSSARPAVVALSEPPINKKPPLFPPRLLFWLFFAGAYPAKNWSCKPSPPSLSSVIFPEEGKWR